MSIINNVREKLETGSYYVKDYASFKDLLKERDMTINDYMDRITEVHHVIIGNVPVVVYENPESSLFQIAYITEDVTTESVLNQLQS